MTFFCPNGDIWIFTEMFVKQSSVSHMNLVHIAEFDWLSGRQIVNVRKLFINLLRR